MKESGAKTFTGPFEETPWPDKLKARVVTPGPRPRIHGYDVEGDLARHYGFPEILLLTLTGELPDTAMAKMFETALAFLSPCAIADAPSHAASLARLCGSGPAGVLQTGFIALVEHARHLLDAHAKLFEWLDNPDRPVPLLYTTDDEEERKSVGRLREALGATGGAKRYFDCSLTLTAAVFSVLHSCGIRGMERMLTVICTAKLGCMAAEAFAVKPGDFTSYPANLPEFRYVEGKE